MVRRSSAPLRRIARPGALVGALLSSCALGCSSGVQDDAGVETSSGVGSLALVHVERQSDTSAAEPHVTSSVKVARYRGIDGDRLLRLLGADTHDLDTCAVVGGLDDAPLPASAHVELMSVGNIALRLGDEAHELSPRLFPALATTAGGFFYADAFDSEMADAAEYGVSAAGTAGVGRLELTLNVPDQVAGFRVAGESPAQSVIVARASDLELTWEPGTTGDHLEVELFVGGSVLACALRDDGQFVIARGKLELLDADDNAALLLRRVRITAVEVQGVENAYARVSSARTFSAQLR